MRFFIWRTGWVVSANWCAVPPSAQEVWDCTEMDDGEFDELMAELADQEHRNTSPGNAGDPGFF